MYVGDHVGRDSGLPVQGATVSSMERQVVVVISTGGTIASTTRAVGSAEYQASMTGRDLLKRVPGLEALADIEAVDFLSKHGYVLTLERDRGARIHLLHITTRDAIKELRASRSRYPAVHVEVCPPYLSTPPAELDSRWKFRPPISDKEHAEGLWRGGWTALLIRSAKTEDILKPAAGAGGTHYILPFMLSEGFHWARGVTRASLRPRVATPPNFMASIRRRGLFFPVPTPISSSSISTRSSRSEPTVIRPHAISASMKES